MKSAIKLLVVLSTFFAGAFFASAQRSIGVVDDAPKPAVKNQLDIPVSDWTGQTFIFLEKPKMLQEFGYIGMRLAKKQTGQQTGSELEVNFGDLKYEKFVGKRIKVISIEPSARNSFEYLVAFQEETNDLMIYADSYKQFVNGIAPAADLEKAKSRWLGKTIWTKQAGIITYDAEKDKYGVVKTSIGDPLKVVDVWWGHESAMPIWLIVETKDKQQGYLAVAFSWTNIYKDWWKNYRPWEDVLFETDPKQLGWPDETWAKIREGKAVVGMTKPQVILSWKRPDKINETLSDTGSQEQWVYGDQLLYFEGNVLKTIQGEK